jgi:outer membrane protein assembly factor BamB
MASSLNAAPAPRAAYRLWPGIIVVALQWLLWLVVPAFFPHTSALGLIAGFTGGLLVLIWWLFFSRAPWVERLGAVSLMVIGVAATTRAVHASIANGMMGFMPIMYAGPVLSLALVVWAAATRRLPVGTRRLTLVAAIIVGCAFLTVIRTDGISGDADSDLEWRWTPTPEQQLLARSGDEPPPAASDPRAPEAPRDAPAEAPLPTETPTPEIAGPPASTGETPPAGATGAAPIQPAETAAAEPARGAVASLDATTRDRWPGFRGPRRDGIVRGVRIETNWAQSPPIEMWRRPIGPGWSSFAVAGDRFYTQEQRGDDEVVSAYVVRTGEPVWMHRDAARFWESNAGPGPRGTPTVDGRHIYTLGATGIVNALDARDGSRVWSRNAVTDTGATIPPWGIASSPLVVGDVVVVASAGRLVAYDRTSGNPRWFGPREGGGYSSPHLTTLAGVTQIVLVNGRGIIGVSPSDGAVLWKHDWAGDSIVQPAVVPGGDLLVGSGSGLADKIGTLRLSVSRGAEGWTVAERWTSNGLKSYFNDFVVHRGHAFGFDGSILACIDLDDGTRAWKGGRFGHGQLVLLPDQDLLLVLSEEGELALVKAAPDQFTEVARFKAIEGKTWNHPVLVGDVVLVRNGEEMAAFRLSLASRLPSSDTP